MSRYVAYSICFTGTTGSSRTMSTKEKEKEGEEEGEGGEDGDY